MFNLIVILVCGLGYFIASETMGRFLLRRIGYSPASFFDVLCAGLGLTVLTFILILLGLTGLFVPAAMVALSGIAVLLALGRLISELRYTKKTETIQEDVVRWNAFFLHVSLPVLVIVCLISVLTPETRHDPYDYHLTVPSLYLAEGKIVEIPWHVFSYMPKNCEMLYGLALGTSNDSLARMIHFLFGWLCVLTVYTFMKRLGSHEISLFAAFLTATLPIFGFIVTAAYIDLARAFWELTALYALYLVWDEKTGSAKFGLLIVSSLFAGMAVGTKYVSLLVFIPSYSILLVLTIIMVPRMKSIGLILGVLLALILPSSVWSVLNAAWTGNPIYPMLPSVFGMNIAAAGQAYSFFRSHAPTMETLTGWSISPFFLMRIKNLLIEGNALILFGAVSLISYAWWRSTQHGRRLPVFALNGLLISILLSSVLFLVLTDNRDGRFFLSTLALLSVPTALFLYALSESLQQRSSLGRYIMPAVTVFLFLNAVSYRYNQIKDLHEPMIPMFTEEQRTQWLSRRFPFYPLVDWANKNLPKDSYVLGMGYPLRCRHISNVKYGSIPFLENVSPDIDPAQLALVLAGNGITHVVKPYPQLPNDIDLSVLETDYLTPLFNFRGMVLFKLDSPGSPS